jgi:pimeloyl-ACP methyl ester carboxylesterase
MNELYVRDSGDSELPAVVFLHGAGVSGRMWSGYVDQLGGFRCLAPDLPGFGRSVAVPWRSREATADLIAQLIETRVPERRAHLVGLSVGGALAHTLLDRRADLLDRVLIDGAGALPWRGSGPYLLGIAAISPFLHTRVVIAALSRSVGQIPEADRADIRLASTRAFRRSYVDAFATRITRAEISAPCPTLLVAGEKERAVRPSNAALAALMPNAVARYVPGTGHGWLGVEYELHVAMVKAWLENTTLPDGLVPETMRWPEQTVQRLVGDEGLPVRRDRTSGT